ncbi:MAG: N-6 DNA methylase [Ignavibacteriaceae bacterium]|nr:N-6 DNA methylase [Ignavibacteriaceae bacterium]
MNLNIFNTTNLFEAATNLFQQLNIKLNSNTAEPLPTKDILKHYYKDNDTFKAIDKTYFIGIIDDSVFQATGMFDVNYSIKEALQQGDKNYDGLMLFALELTKKPTRTEISEITRAFNRISQKMPVALVLKYSIEKEAVISIAISERFKYLQNWRQGEKAGKVIILRDIFTSNTHAGHQRILLDLVKPAGVTNYAQLHAQWLEVLDVNILNKKFFQELANWYFWAMDKVQFPDDIEKKKDVRNATNLIRLITRVIFIWFIKEKHLVPASLFNEKYLEKILKDFQKNKKSSNYYQAILQNLFFGTLNQKMNERDFAEDHNRTNKLDQGIKNKYRYPDKFNISKKEIITLFEGIPFLNGGLFDCLDKFDEEKLEKGKKEQIFVDGFTRLDGKQAIVPDYLFFGEEVEVDLTEYYDPEAKKAIIKKVNGLLHILNSFKFTVAENTPIEEEIALDPELLGKVFENLLASYNPETKTTARKQTGSFYTPREIVNYMVDESLIEYLKQNTEIKTDDFDNRLRNLFSYNEEGNPFKPKETDELIEAINNAKILDPACGSGAFPMGILHKMVHILQKLDPGNVKWKAQQKEKIIGNQIKELEKDKKAITGLSDKAVREKAIQAVDERLKEIDEIFESKNNFDDYARKLYLIENCIYGIDIQPIAVQISKLRFFISLIIDQDKDSKKENLGFRSLPNLETKFVASNTLISLEIPTTDLFSENNPIKVLQEELKSTRHEYFNAKTREDKLRLQQQDKELRKKIAAQISDSLINKKEEEIANLEKQLAEAKKKLTQIENGPEQKETIESTNLFGQIETIIIDKKKEKIKAQKSIISTIEKQINTLKATDNKDAIQKVAQQISSFDPYDQNTFANWFAPEWMFGMTSGFDIVIGNPPYGAKFTESEKEYFKKTLKHQDYQPESFLFFTEKSFDFLKNQAVLSFIIPNTWLTNLKLVKIRRFLTGSNTIQNISHYHKSVFDAVVDTEVVILKKGYQPKNQVKVFRHLDSESILELKHSQDNWKEKNGDVINIFTNEQIDSLVKKLKLDSKPLSDYADVYAGLVPYEEGKGRPAQTKAMMKGKIYNSDKKIDKTYRKVLRGSDINKYVNNWDNRWIKYGDNLAAPRKETIFNNPKIVVRQTGDSLIATYDDEKYVTLKNTHVINKKTTVELKFLLALINSNLLNFYFQYLNPETGEALAEVKKENVEKLLIKLPKDQKPFINLVDKILDAKKTNHVADTSKLEKQIDELVYKLYDLTEEEIKIIEGNE